MLLLAGVETMRRGFRMAWNWNSAKTGLPGDSARTCSMMRARRTEKKVMRKAVPFWVIRFFA